MTTRHPLPSHLPPAFSVGAALAAGVPLGRLEASDLQAPFHGTRGPTEAPDTLQTKCRILSTRFRQDDAFTGPTAARLWGMPLPSRLQEQPSLFVSSRAPTRSLRREGVVGTSRFSTDPLHLNGIPLLPVWETCLSLATMVRVDDLTAILDFVVTGKLGKNPLSSLLSLDSFLMESAGKRGIFPMRSARRLTRQGAWSRTETLLRLLLLRAGLPEPELNFELTHPSGRIMIPDLAWPHYRVAAEYNGVHHDKPDQRVRDLRRVDDFVDIGWTTVNVDRTQLFQHPASTVLRVTERLQDRGWVATTHSHLPKSAG